MPGARVNGLAVVSAQVVDGNYVDGNHFDITLHFNKNVVVDTNTDTTVPYLGLTIGSVTTKKAVYTSSASSNTALVFRYTVQSGDQDTDGPVIAPTIELNGGGIADASDNDLSPLTFTAPYLGNVRINDSTAPSIGTVSINDGTHALLVVSVNMSEEVIVNTENGIPRIALSIDDTARYATYESGTGTTTLLFSYRAGALESDTTGGIGMTASIDLNSGTIQDRGGNAITDLSFTLPSNLDQVNVDGSMEVARWVRVYNKNYRADDRIDISVMYEKPVTVTGTPRIPLDIGGTERFATYTSGTGGKLLTFSYTVASGEQDRDGIGIKHAVDLYSGSAITIAGNDAVDVNFHVPKNLPFVKVDTDMPFISRWRTTSANESITLPLPRSRSINGVTAEYNFRVDWGDGASEVITNAFGADHTYAQAGTYTVTITGRVDSWDFTNGGADKIIEVVDLGDVGWRSLEGAFQGCSNLTSVSGGVLSSVISTEDMFRVSSSSSLSTLNAQGWDVSNVTNMRYMFRGSSIANLYGGTWDVSSVTNMAYMFENASNVNPDVRDWDVSSVTDMSYMFDRASVVNPDVTNWDVSSVTTMFAMFRGATVANPNVSHWNVSNVTSMGSMFSNAESANPNFAGANFASIQNMETFLRRGQPNYSFSSTNYSNLLIALENTVTSRSVTLTLPNDRFERGLLSEAWVARNNLIDNYNWTILD